MTDPGILAAFSEQCDAPIRFFDLVELYYLEKVRQAFLCIGKHGFFFLKKKSLQLLTKAQLYYEYIEKFVENSTLETDLCILLSSKRSPEWSSDTLWIRTFQRGALIGYIHVAWSTDRMVRYGRAAQFPLYKHSFKNVVWGDMKQLNVFYTVKPFIDYKEVIYSDFFFYLHNSYRDRISIMGRENTGNYRDDKGIDVTVHVHQGLPITTMTEINNDSMDEIAGAYRNSITEVFHECTMILDGPYNKKFNLTDDPAFWVGWEMACETSLCYIVVILLRRNYATAFMDIFQDIAIIFQISQNDAKSHNISLEDLMFECRLAADSFSPIPRVHYCHRDLLQYKLDALLFDDKAYSWFHTRLKLKPNLFSKCQDFIESLVQILNKHNCLRDKELVYKLSGRSNLDDSPKMLLSVILKQTEGFDIYDTESSEHLSLFHQWQYRCSCYLTYLLSGNFLNGRLDMRDLVDALGHLGPDDSEMVRDFLAFFLHFRSNEWTQPFMKNFLFTINETIRPETIVFNERAVQILLQCGYLRSLFPKENDDQFIFLICALLKTNRAFALKLATFQYIFQMCCTDQDEFSDLQRQKNFLMGVLPSLIHLVKLTSKSPLASLTEISQAPFFTTLAVAALVTMSAGNSVVKSLLLDSGIADVVVNQIRVADNKLQLYCVQLCINLTKTSAQRQRFIDAGLLPILVDTFLNKYKSTNMTGKVVVYEIAGVLGQLANEPELRNELLTRYPVLDCALYLFHNAGLYSHESLRVIYCIRQLGNQNWQIRQRIGLHVIEPTVHALKYISLAQPEFRVSYATRCLSLLLTVSKYKPNCFKLKELNVESVLQSLKEILASSISASSLEEKCDFLLFNVTKNTAQELL